MALRHLPNGLIFPVPLPVPGSQGVLQHFAAAEPVLVPALVDFLLFCF